MVKDSTSIKIEQELEESRKSEALLAKLLENSSQPFGVGYPDGRLGLVNKAFEELTGYSREELKSTDWSEILTPHKFRDMENKKLEELQHTGQPVKYEKEYIRKDGTRLPIELLVHIVKNEDGTPEYYYSFITDISERKKAEKLSKELLEKEQLLTEELQTSNEELQSTTEELQVTNEELQQQQDYLMEINHTLKESEEKFLKAFHGNPAPMTLSDEYKFIDVNESYSELTGYSREELIGHNTADLNILDSEKGKNHLIESQKRGSTNDIEFVLHTKSGEKRIITSSSELIELGGKTLYISFNYDITELKEKEKLNDALNRINANINSILDYNEIMNSIVKVGAKAIGAESSLINLLENDKWVVKFVYNFPNDIVGQIKLQQESPTSVYVANKKKAVAFNDAANDSRVNINGMKIHGVASVLVAPIILKDKVKGIIAFYHHNKPVIFTEAQIDFANKLASSLSQALENAELFENIKKSEELIKKNEKLLHTVS